MPAHGRAPFVPRRRDPQWVRIPARVPVDPAAAQPVPQGPQGADDRLDKLSILRRMPIEYLARLNLTFGVTNRVGRGLEEALEWSIRSSLS